jgi:hypothetical protein
VDVWCFLYENRCALAIGRLLGALSHIHLVNIISAFTFLSTPACGLCNYTPNHLYETKDSDHFGCGRTIKPRRLAENYCISHSWTEKTMVLYRGDPAGFFSTDTSLIVKRC